ncbi:hypothetical protein PM082_011983 [Marasmius tenuissimus]|nr:hypothetical protein PM082_011983 [Marasmius tenuissimus]
MIFCVSILLSFTALALGLATGDVKVSVKAVSSSVSSIEDVVLTAIVFNPSNRDIRVLALNNILDDQPTRSFSVTKDGKEVTFTGIHVTPDLDNQANWVTILAGQSVSVNHTVSKLYNFEPHGTGTYMFAPNAIFQTTMTEPLLVVNVDSVQVEVVHNGDVSFRYLIPPSASLSSVSCADPGRAQILRDAHENAKLLATNTITDIRNNPNSVNWGAFFGGNDREEIIQRFTLIAQDSCHEWPL